MEKLIVFSTLLFIGVTATNNYCEYDKLINTNIPFNSLTLRCKDVEVV